MAEVINEIIGKEAFAQIERLESGLKGLVDTFIKSSNAAKLLEAALLKESTVKGVNDAIKQQKTQLSELEKYQKQMESQILKLAFADRELGKQRAKNAVELEQQNAVNKTAAREQLAAEGSINQMSASLVKMRREYDALSKTMRESPLGTELVKRIQATDAALKAMDGNTGRFQRNVGDYKNQLFGLTQVFRKVNGTMGAMKIFASSIFSFGNIFAIAIGLFTIFSKQIFEMFQSTEKLNKSQEAFIELQKQTNKQMTTEIGNGKLLLDILNNMNLSVSQRTKAYDDLNNLYPELLSNMSKEDVLANGLNDSYYSLLSTITQLAKKKGQMALLQDLVAQQVKLQNDLDVMLNPKEGEFIYYTQDQLERVKGNLSTVNDKIKSITKSMELAALAESQSFILSGGRRPNKTSTQTGSGKSGGGGSSPTAEKTYNLKGWGDVMSNLDMFANEGNGIGAQAELIRQRLQAYIDENPISISIEWTRADRFDVFLEQLKKALSEAVELTAQSTQIMSDISDAIYANEMKRITAREKKMNEYYDAETKRVNSSFTNQADKDRELKKLEVQKEAQQKRIDRDRITADRKRAQQQKAYDIANITTSTALAVIKAYTEGDPLTKIPRAILAAAAGAASLARAIAAPIPQYAKGTDSHIGGLAVVGEQGTELVTLPSGKQFLTPSTDTLMNLPKGTKVLNNEKLMQSVYNLAFKKLGNGMAVNTDSMQVAMLEAFNELTTDVKELKKAMIGKDTNVNIIGNFDHYMHIKKNIR